MAANRPDFHDSMKPSEAEPMFNALLDKLRASYDPAKVHGATIQPL